MSDGRPRPASLHAGAAGLLSRMGSLRYENVQIFKQYQLGRGSFGAVYKAQCDDLPCAAKVLHPTLVDPQGLILIGATHNKVQERFQQECQFLDSIRHPNIVLYLGMCPDPDTQQPALLMELLDESLTDMLDSLTSPLPYHIQVNVCHDVSLAIAYLHSQNIIHRDLSSNNVLMIARRKAKVGDFGVSRIVDFDRHSSTPLSLCPGTKAYMSPEALKEPPNYTEKLDVFSFGVIIVQLLTRLFPRPTSSTRDVEDSRSQGRRVQEIVSERERRKDHIGLIESSHPLLVTILACLNDEGEYRPTASQLCRTFSELKQSSVYQESRQDDHLIDSSPRSHTSNFERTNGVTSSESDSSELKKKLYEMEELKKKLYEKEKQLWQSKEKTARTEEQQILRFDQIIEAQRKEISEKDTRIQQLDKELKDSERLTADFQRELQTTQQQLHQRQRLPSLPSPTAPSPPATSPLINSPRTLQRRFNQSDKLKMNWRPIASVPSSLHRGASACHNGIVYLAFKSMVFSYSITAQIWTQLPNCPQANGSLVMTNEFPTIIGGERNGRVTNSLITLMGHTNESNWIESFPKMPTARAYSSAVKCNGHVMVIGGCSSTKLGEGVLSVVEVLEIGEVECMWFSVSSLCYPLADASAVVYHGQVMLIGGTDSYGETLTNLKCSIQELLNTKTKIATNGNREGSNTRSGSSLVWKYLTDSKLFHSTGVAINGHLLAIGGVGSNNKSTTYMFHYNCSNSLWEQIGLMNVARSLCFAVSLPNNEIMVVGGNTSNPATITNLAEIATIL
jgi:serine/threonine protein kinase